MNVYFFIAMGVTVWILQTALGFWQFKKFNEHVKSLRREGRVAIGRARGYFSPGVWVLFVIDDQSCAARLWKGAPFCRVQTF